jgi:hypothetical protein
MKIQIQFKVLVFLVSAIFLYCVGWLIASQWIKSEVETFLTDTLVKNGKIEIHYEALERGGFPFSLDWHLLNPKVKVNFVSHTVSFNTNKTTLSIHPFFKKSVIVQNQKTEWRLLNNRDHQKFKNISDNSRLSLSKNYDGTITAEYSANNSGVHQFVSTNERKQWDKFALGKHFSALISLPNGEKRTEKTSYYSISFKINNILIINESVIWPKNLDGITGSIELRGNPGTFALEDLIAWRDNGGTIDIERIQFEKAPHKLIVKGTLALDADLKPIGAGTIDFAGLATLLNEQQKAGRITKSEASFLHLAILVLSKTTNHQEKSMIRIPITAQNGKLKIGSFSLFDLPGLIR